ncbi:uncharacterized protein LOC125320303 isoform X5 [Corvus hawaiiensis]|uniref:uncharacterized protein LOC125320303 isoform X5 n=1 Tax=Corvus hawaiiensis TaxID=134902 RepID=UPI0020196CF9|nr:uncharacterized protein LOC125320303 isoform X5 [Corvus hawaiiensis]
MVLNPLGMVLWRSQVLHPLGMLLLSFSFGNGPVEIPGSPFPGNGAVEVLQVLHPLGMVLWRSQVLHPLGMVLWRSQVLHPLGMVLWRSQVLHPLGMILWRSQDPHSLGMVLWRFSRFSIPWEWSCGDPRFSVPWEWSCGGSPWEWSCGDPRIPIPWEWCCGGSPGSASLGNGAVEVLQVLHPLGMVLWRSQVLHPLGILLLSFSLGNGAVEIPGSPFPGNGAVEVLQVLHPLGMVLWRFSRFSIPCDWSCGGSPVSPSLGNPPAELFPWEWSCGDPGIPIPWEWCCGDSPGSPSLGNAPAEVPHPTGILPVAPPAVRGRRSRWLLSVSVRSRDQLGGREDKAARSRSATETRIYSSPSAPFFGVLRVLVGSRCRVRNAGFGMPASIPLPFRPRANSAETSRAPLARPDFRS